VVPDDIHAIAIPVLAHRLVLTAEAQAARRSPGWTTTGPDGCSGSTTACTSRMRTLRLLDGSSSSTRSGVFPPAASTAARAS
ncbi:hypothetical protein ABZX92_33810, partial [Lentzea sp. NPDC006480]|uniref:hypothetical protein n=1 Tax=Lentzea sp. NPDC006480 TaxID=3157176 RepID=UPI0033A261E6